MILCCLAPTLPTFQVPTIINQCWAVQKGLVSVVKGLRGWAKISCTSMERCLLCTVLLFTFSLIYPKQQLDRGINTATIWIWRYLILPSASHCIMSDTDWPIKLAKTCWCISWHTCNAASWKQGCSRSLFIWSWYKDQVHQQRIRSLTLKDQVHWQWSRSIWRSRSRSIINGR